MDPDKLDWNDWLAGGGSALFILLLFLPWYSVGPFSANAFTSVGTITMIFAILGVALSVMVVLRVLGKLAANLGTFEPPLKLNEAIFYIAAGAAEFLFVLFSIIFKPKFGSVGFSFGFAIWIAIVAALATGAGGVLRLQGKQLGGARAPAGYPPGYQQPYPQQGYPQQAYPQQQQQPQYPQQGYPQQQPQAYPPPAAPQPQPGYAPPQPGYPPAPGQPQAYPPPAPQPQPGYPPQQPGYPPQQ